MYNNKTINFVFALISALLITLSTIITLSNNPYILEYMGESIEFLLSIITAIAAHAIIVFSTSSQFNTEKENTFMGIAFVLFAVSFFFEQYPFIPLVSFLVVIMIYGFVAICAFAKVFKGIPAIILAGIMYLGAFNQFLKYTYVPAPLLNSIGNILLATVILLYGIRQLKSDKTNANNQSTANYANNSNYVNNSNYSTNYVPAPQNVQNDSISVADELAALKVKFESGLITEDVYQTERAKLISKL